MPSDGCSNADTVSSSRPPKTVGTRTVKAADAPTGEHGSASENDAKYLENGDKEQTEEDMVIVDWDGPSDTSNPKNWPYRTKWVATLVVSSFTFISPVSSAMIAPASDQVAHDFGITNDVLIAMTTSVFLLGYAWNTGCGFAKNATQLLLFRFLAGVGGGAPLAIGGGVLGDIWLSEERGKAIAVYSLAPLLGPAIGPVCGGWIAERSTWRWVFWSTSLVDVIVQVTGLFYLRESYAPVLLERKADQIRKRMDIEREPQRLVRTVFDSAGDSRT
ncbi:Efflux pump vrtL [Psilocybe cubensis]|uniref:Efflux pump vrtL n=1 Tax=Psilocybe cubensis TaxID=181762 RepID=A0ACB8GM87_PSICU|nr:Efflux pump vrtL [Psilocybe cubensis]KAH9476321.1 Efflux pump vrtL [Psilocybe cubensis]